ncbi:unnamed protein product, partial [marine sediment metagenome]
MERLQQKVSYLTYLALNCYILGHMNKPGNDPKRSQNPLLRPSRKVWSNKLGESQKDQIAESKWIIVIAATVLVFICT